MVRFEQAAGGWTGKRIAVLGLSFKPNTNDLREAPSTKIIPILTGKGAHVVGYDPMANEFSKAFFADAITKQQVEIVDSVSLAISQADVVFVLVEWPELVTLNPSEVATQVKPKALFIDIRDQYQRAAVETAGLTYMGIGV
jgi:UDPglucose 6-dehydrogenase